VGRGGAGLSIPAARKTITMSAPAGGAESLVIAENVGDWKGQDVLDLDGEKHTTAGEGARRLAKR
jgi:hypothetical protein